MTATIMANLLGEQKRRKRNRKTTRRSRRRSGGPGEASWPGDAVGRASSLDVSPSQGLDLLQPRPLSNDRGLTSAVHERLSGPCARRHDASDRHGRLAAMEPDGLIRGSRLSFRTGPAWQGDSCSRRVGED